MHSAAAGIKAVVPEMLKWNEMKGLIYEIAALSGPQVIPVVLEFPTVLEITYHTPLSDAIHCYFLLVFLTL